VAGVVVEIIILEDLVVLVLSFSQFQLHHTQAQQQEAQRLRHQDQIQLLNGLPQVAELTQLKRI
jgi:hypothetical protein